jgi:hypothetical protein
MIAVYNQCARFISVHVHVDVRTWNLLGPFPASPEMLPLSEMGQL